MKQTRPKISIVEYTHDLIDPNVLIAYTADGGRLRLTLAPDDILPPVRKCHCPLYATEHKILCTLVRGKLGQIFETFPPSRRTPGRYCHNGKRGCTYPDLQNFGHIPCHTLILLIYCGSRPVYPDGQLVEGDHKNGDNSDFSLENLEWVHPSENDWRSRHVLQPLRSKGINPATYTGSQMDHWFEIFRHLESVFAPIRPAQLFTREDFLAWFNMPFDAFKSRIDFPPAPPGTVLPDCEQEPNRDR